jgi:hypothetical protein
MSAGTLEIRWMLEHPKIFEQVTSDRVTPDRGRGVWKVHFPPPAGQ